ncbi:MAG: NUDIX hydrolase N-terminal domain-containing protein [Acidimicrobiales bacterium]|jgi:8-oxo-dGTP pyrophosphatase MutT (NUDIX family)|nr:NUDIX hydrolase N-terminal domain-containing protein [Acidimicrobiales bacterium]MDP7117902.1 NUDIX hydrolase N-terminal domain-containing protein [Acidimicrobiales bacterium]MDP7411463.1 NUDIX hydrolase N-terminal domain-containing protein [Acidimicrobiales bacterium]MEE1521254.1 NUDIX hydrolase N-terminal domain-containing protein [Acidimicrobiales bacterium]MEE1571543.1 NUDIX hydrolase N-terminal domain-containing protein [Acidimicrobiales bacterium]|tara:strand:- start:10133 stop:10837 length:705 start_codon:yes stop_codon:yes gene_type:complete
MNEPGHAPPTRQELLRWAESLAAIARTGLGFTEVLYEQERFEEVLKVAADIRVRAESGGETQDVGELMDGWLASVGEGVPGYVTPKSTVAAVVGNDDGDLLLVQRAESGLWLYPTGWADVGYSPAEVVIKEVLEETGIHCEVVRPIAILDGFRLGFTGIPLYSLVFHCRMTGGELRAHPLECRDVGFFAEGCLPDDTVLPDEWADEAFRAIRGEHVDVRFDAPRDPPWRGDEPT